MVSDESSLKIVFKEEDHTYTREDSVLYTPVSTVIHSVEPKVDWKQAAIKNSKNLKRFKNISITPTELLAKWDNARVKGSQAGTIVHKIKEEEEGYISRDGEKYSMDITNLSDGVYRELMIYDHARKICGQSDKIEIIDNTINVLDYKTDKSIDFRGYSSEWKEAEKLLPPVSHLEKCNGNIYSLKMSLYMYMLWEANKGRLKPGKIKLIWCPIERDEDGIPILYDGIPKIIREQVIEIPYRKKEVLNILKAYES
jgi:hypothetical protein